MMNLAKRLVLHLAREVIVALGEGVWVSMASYQDVVEERDAAVRDRRKAIGAFEKSHAALRRRKERYEKAEARIDELECRNLELERRRGGECQICGSWVCPPLTCFSCQDKFPDKVSQEAVAAADKRANQTEVERDRLAQKLADSPCPVCLSEWQTYRECGDKDCPHCGAFPEPRRGHFAIDAEDAHRRVKEEQDAQSRTDKG